MTENVVSFPRELFDASSPQGWQSVGEAAGFVLSSVALGSARQLRAYPILREEGSETAEMIAIAAPAE